MYHCSSGIRKWPLKVKPCYQLSKIVPEIQVSLAFHSLADGGDGVFSSMTADMVSPDNLDHLEDLYMVTE